jgi:site-specific recombinase XerD
MRDSALLKTYAYGMRRRENVGLDLADLRRNPKAPQYKRHGALFVRWGKSSKGSQPKRRTVFTVPKMDWIVDVLDRYLTEVRPRFDVGTHPAIRVTESSGRLSRRSANEAFEAAGQAADRWFPASRPHPRHDQEAWPTWHQGPNRTQRHPLGPLCHAGLGRVPRRPPIDNSTSSIERTEVTPFG